MPDLWLRVAASLYGLGLLYALITIWGKKEVLSRVVVSAVALGTLFHLVSLVESGMASASGGFSGSRHQVESLLAFLLMVFFLGFYAKYRTASPGIFVFPLVFLLTLSAVLGRHPETSVRSDLAGSGWLFFHIALIFSGYAALFFSFASSILYLVQERSLKSKHLDGIIGRLPALEVIDNIGYRSLMLGFPFMTLGLIAGSVIAQARFGPAYFQDPKVIFSVLMWLIYTGLLFSRWSAGWRGRRAAMLSMVAVASATVAWAANYYSTMHRIVGP